MKNGEATAPIVCVVNGEEVHHRPTYVVELQTMLRKVIELAKRDYHPTIREAKELIRCRVTGCGLAGACHGGGTKEYPCPLK